MFPLILCGCAGSTGKSYPPLVTDVASDLPRPISRRDWRRWESRLQAHLLDEPTDAAALALLGHVYHQEGRLTAARQTFERSLKLQNRPEVRYHLALVHEQLGEDKSALRQARRALEDNPQLGDAHALCGRVHRRAGRNDLASAELEAGWASSPPSVTAGVEMARWQVEREQWSDAENRLRLCLVHEPDHTAARRLYAEVLTHLGATKQAIIHWQHLVDRGEIGAEGFLALADLYQRSGDNERAQAHLLQAQRLAPRDPKLARLQERVSAPPVARATLPDLEPYQPLVQPDTGPTATAATPRNPAR